VPGPPSVAPQVVVLSAVGSVHCSQRSRRIRVCLSRSNRTRRLYATNRASRQEVIRACRFPIRFRQSNVKPVCRSFSKKPEIVTIMASRGVCI
jgi:hypothetical protein